MSSETTPKKTPGCGYLISEPIMPVVSLVAGWAGLDRSVIGDYMTAARKMGVMFGLFWSISNNGEHHPLTALLMTAFMYGWISDIIWTRRDYRASYSMPTNPPRWGRALTLALIFGLSGIDRIYINDRFFGALKLGLSIVVATKTDGIPQSAFPVLEQVGYCWYACDIVLSPLRARLQ